MTFVALTKCVLKVAEKIEMFQLKAGASINKVSLWNQYYLFCYQAWATARRRGKGSCLFGIYKDDVARRFPCKLRKVLARAEGSRINTFEIRV